MGIWEKGGMEVKPDAGKRRPTFARASAGKHGDAGRNWMRRGGAWATAQLFPVIPDIKLACHVVALVKTDSVMSRNPVVFSRFEI
jgi:hypothetical protein